MSICRKVNPNRIMPLALALLALGNIAHWLIQRHSGWPENVADFASGAAMGVGIASVLVAIVVTTRGKRS